MPAEPILHCPSCDVPLVADGAASVRGHRCPGCRGRLVEREALARVTSRSELERAWARVAVVSESRDRTCPRCVLPMRALEVRGREEIDACARCELLWFDTGEIARVRALWRRRSAPEPDHGLVLAWLGLEAIALVKQRVFED